MRHLIIVLAALLMVRGIANAAVALPAELEGIQLGMSKAELLAARPGIQLKGMMGEALDIERPNFIVFEFLKSTASVYSAITYSIEGNKLTAVALTGYPKKGEEKATRKRAIKGARALYGRAKNRRVPEDAIRKGRGIAAFTWDLPGYEVLLMLPVKREQKDSRVSPVSLQIRPVTPKNKPLADMKLTKAEKDAVLKENDADDMESSN